MILIDGPVDKISLPAMKRIYEPGTIVYLGGPMTSKSMATMDFRAAVQANAYAYLMKAGFHVFAPLLPHNVTKQYGLAFDYEPYAMIDETFIDRVADVVAFLCMPGWRESKGISRELAAAANTETPYHFIEFDSNAPLWAESYGE
jgi:hypothetical protein